MGLPARLDDGFCGAKTRAGTPCRKTAGWGTDHVGVGRCRLHGGATPIKHGARSQLRRYGRLNHRIGELIEVYEQDPDPTNILSEIAAMRALFHDWIERYEEWKEQMLLWWATVTGRKSQNPEVAAARLVLNDAAPRQLMDISDGGRLISEATKMVARLEKIRSQDAISRPELARIWQEMWRAVQMECDEDTADRIREAWLRIRL